MAIVGLVFIAPLALTPPQWLALGLSTAGWLWQRRGSGPDREDGPGQGGPAALLLFSLLWAAFRNTPTCADTYLLFKNVSGLSDLTWAAFLREVVRHAYVDHQPPFLTFWLARLPVLWAQQLLWFPWAVLCAGLMRTLYGPEAAFLLATPVVALMIHQPSHDLLLFGMLLIVRRLAQLSKAALGRQSKALTLLSAAAVYGLTYLIKPLTILTAPFILPQLGWFGLLSLGMWGGYVGWSCQYAFGRQQAVFLLHQLLLRSMSQSSLPAIPNVPLTWPAHLSKTLRFFWHTFVWRWNHLGCKAVQALPFYLFPTYLRRWRWRSIVLTFMIVLGYGNIKYLLLALLFVLPIQTEAAR